MKLRQAWKIVLNRSATRETTRLKATSRLLKRYGEGFTLAVFTRSWRMK